MHDNSLKLMRAMLTAYPQPTSTDTVIDIGSQDVNGTYRSIVEEEFHARYCGVDICVGGKNVDVVPNDDWTNVPRSRVVISGQCLEHTTQPWKWIRRVRDCVLPGGWLIVIAPWRWEFHEFPVDCWRVLPDGMRGLFAEAELETVQVGMDEDDCFGVARRGVLD